jgi:hypothetical protein
VKNQQKIEKERAVLTAHGYFQKKKRRLKISPAAGT